MRSWLDWLACTLRSPHPTVHCCWLFLFENKTQDISECIWEQHAFDLGSFFKNQSLRGSENFQGVPAHAAPKPSPPGGFHPDRTTWAQGRTQKSELLLWVRRTKLCLDTHTWTFKAITSKFLSAVQNIFRMPKLTPQQETPRSIKQPSFLWSALLCWEAGKTLLFNSNWGLSWQIASICNCRSSLEHLNGILCTSASPCVRLSLTILSQIYFLFFYTNKGIYGLNFLRKTSHCRFLAGCTDKCWRDIFTQECRQPCFGFV